VLDPPSLPTQRFYPRRSRMVLIGAAAGFIVGALYVLAESWWRHGGRRRRLADERD